MDTNWPPQNKVSLQQALCLIIRSKGINALASPYLCNSLNDFTDYDGERMYRNIFKGIVAEDILANIVVEINKAITPKTVLENAYYTAVNQYGYNESGVKYLLDIIAKVLSLNLEENSEQDFEISNTSNINPDASLQEIPKFMGIPLGIHINDFIRELKQKRPGINRCPKDFALETDIELRLKQLNLEHFSSSIDAFQDVRTFDKFSFAGIPNCTLSIYPSLSTREVYKVLVRLNQISTEEEMVDKIKSLLKTKYGEPSSDSLILPPNHKKKQNRCQYFFKNGLNIEYRLMHWVARLNHHYMMYSSNQLLLQAKEEIDQRIDELKKNAYLSALDEI